MDAATSHDCAALGAIIRNRNGHIMVSYSLTIHTSSSINALEANAVIHSISLARTYGISDFLIETDCLDLCQRVNSPSHDHLPVGFLVHQIRGFLHHSLLISLNYVNRKAIVVVHSLARLGLSYST